MPQEARLNFNRGLISPAALGRGDLDRVSLSAAQQTNWVPRVLGNMALRPGLELVRGDIDVGYFVPFIFSTADTAYLHMIDRGFTPYIDDVPLTLPAVSTSVANAGFNTDLTSWTDDDEAGATSSWTGTGYAGGTGGFMSLVGTGFAAARRLQTLTVAGGDQNVEHGLLVHVEFGLLTLRVGSSSGGDEYVNETELGVGVYLFSITPTGGSIYLQLANRRKDACLINQITVVSAGGVQELTILAASGHYDDTWQTSDLTMPSKLRYSQSGDIVYVACAGRATWKIERRATRSWGLVKYEPRDGPFRVENTDPVTISSSDVDGAVTLTASAPLFRSTHPGALFRISSAGQFVSSSVSGENQFTNEVRVTGVGATQRNLAVAISGTWTGTVTLQRSVAEPGAWVDVATWTANTTSNYQDGLDNEIIYYRIGIKSGDYGSGTADLSLTFAGGSITGVVRIQNVASSTSATAQVLTDLGSVDATDVWWEGSWSNRRGFPSALSLYDGRLFLAGKANIWGSVSDGYEAFDDNIEGDSGPISRSLGQGPVDTINWLLPLQRLLVGTDGSEKSVRSSSFDEPLSPTAFTVRNASTQGSVGDAAVIDAVGVFISKSKRRVYELNFDANSYDYSAVDITALVPELGDSHFVQLAVQRQPDTRVHVVRADGTVAMLVHDKVENVRGWIEIETDGTIEQVFVLPGVDEDAVYYVVTRNGQRNIERWALELDCVGGALNKQADSFVVYDGVATTSITGLDHLEGKTVCAWADGVDAGTYVVSGGAITLATAAEQAVVGLPYTADYKSSKLHAWGRIKRIHSLKLLLSNTHARGLQFGEDFDNLSDLPLTEEGADVDVDSIGDYDQDPIPFNGTFGQDSRICLRAQAPRPANVLAVMVEYSAT